MLPSFQSTKVPREPIPITENEGEKFFPRFAWNHRCYAPLSRCLQPGSVSAPIYQPPHPSGTSNGPAFCIPLDNFHEMPVMLMGLRFAYCTKGFASKIEPVDVDDTNDWWQSASCGQNPQSTWGTTTELVEGDKIHKVYEVQQSVEGVGSLLRAQISAI